MAPPTKNGSKPTTPSKVFAILDYALAGYRQRFLGDTEQNKVSDVQLRTELTQEWQEAIHEGELIQDRAVLEMLDLLYSNRATRYYYATRCANEGQAKKTTELINTAAFSPVEAKQVTDLLKVIPHPYCPVFVVRIVDENQQQLMACLRVEDFLDHLVRALRAKHSVALRDKDNKSATTMTTDRTAVPVHAQPFAPAFEWRNEGDREPIIQPRPIPSNKPAPMPPNPQDGKKILADNQVAVELSRENYERLGIVLENCKGVTLKDLLAQLVLVGLNQLEKKNPELFRPRPVFTDVLKNLMQ